MKYISDCQLIIELYSLLIFIFKVYTFFIFIFLFLHV